MKKWFSCGSNMVTEVVEEVVTLLEDRQKIELTKELVGVV